MKIEDRRSKIEEGVFDNKYYQRSLKQTLKKMTDLGGRDTEKDLIQDIEFQSASW